MTPVISPKTLEGLRKKIEDGYLSHGTLHRLLEEWHRIDRAGIPGGGQLIRADAMKVDRTTDRTMLAGTVGLDYMGLQFAQVEAALYFADSACRLNVVDRESVAVHRVAITQ